MDAISLKKFFKAPLLYSSIIILSLALLTSCEKTPHSHHEQIIALGTVVDIKLWDVDEDLAHKASIEIGTTMNSVNERWHAWQPSLLTQINQEIADGKTVSLDAPTFQLLSKAQSLSHQSSGLFHPGLGNLIELWGFHSDNAPKGPPPSVEQRQAWLKKAENIDKLILENNSAKLTEGKMRLDLGGFAKGHAIDLAINRIQALGIKNAIINAGGDLRAIGSKGNTPWRVGVRDPRSTSVIASIETQGDESIFTSGDYERYFEYNNQRYHHLIDPRTGEPARTTTSVTIIHHDAATADAAATAIFIAGPTEWTRIAKQMGIEYVMLIAEDEKIYMSPKMEERVYFLKELKNRPIIQPL